jgi:polysaccharide biosynthesis/export protein
LEPLAASPATSTSTRATIQASSANATDFFNSLLVLLAGGVSQPAELESREALALKEISGLELTSFSFLVQRARLQAEVRKEIFDSTAFIANATDDQLRIVASEEAIFEARERGRVSRRNSYAAQREGYDQEITFIQRSTAYHDEELKLVEEQVSVQENLTDQGLSPRSNLRDLQRELSSTRRAALEFRTALFRAKQNQLALDQTVQEAEINDETTSLETLREIELNLLRNELELGAAREALAKVQLDKNAAENALGRVPVYYLVRRVADAYTSTIVDGSTKLARGDIVRVEVTLPAAGSPAAFMPPRVVTQLPD